MKHTHPSSEAASVPRPDVPGFPPAQRYPAGVELFQQGAAATDVFLIDEGIVKLMRFESDGRELILGLRSPASIVGAAAAIAQRPETETPATLSTCLLRRLPAASFRHLVKTEPALSWHLHEMLSVEVCDQAVRLAQLGCCSSRHRLEFMLWGFVSDQQPIHGDHREVRLRLPLKQYEIAELIAVSPEHLSRLLKEMQREGVVRHDKGWLVVSDLQKLERLVHAAS
jgi:CRP-like cAMP-binding protein